MDLKTNVIKKDYYLLAKCSDKEVVFVANAECLESAKLQLPHDAKFVKEVSETEYKKIPFVMHIV